MVPRADVREVPGGWQAEFRWYAKRHEGVARTKVREREFGPVRDNLEAAVADAERMFWTCLRNPLRVAA